MIMHLLEGKKIVVLDDVISANEAAKMRLVLSGIPLVRKGVTAAAKEVTRHYVADENLDALRSFPFFSSLTEIVAEVFDSARVECHRIVYREIVFGDNFDFHQDGDGPGQVTAILYLNESWEENFHGETLFLGQAGLGVCVIPKPARLTIFDASLRHSSSPPSRTCYEARKVLVFNLTLH